MPTMRRNTVALAAAGLVSSLAIAQQDSTPRAERNWRAFLGCWSTEAAGSIGPESCVLATEDPNTVELITLERDSIASRSFITGNGAKVRISRDGCTGWEMGRWSLDERRLYTESEITCNGGAPRQSRAMYAMTSRNVFSRIEALRTKNATGVRVIHFIAFADTNGLPAEVVRRLPVGDELTLEARANAAAEVSTADVLDASKAVGAPVVEAWLADLGQRFVLNARELRSLRDASVPASVIDMLVAVSNPTLFTIARGGTPGPRAADPRASNGPGTAFAPGMGLSNSLMASSFAYDNLDFRYLQFDASSRYGLFGGRFADPFSMAFQNNGFWYPNPGSQGWLPGGTPYVIAPTIPVEPTSQGRAINGSGYSQGGTSGGGRTAAEYTPSVNSGGGYTSGGGSSGVSTSTGSGTSSSGSGASSSGRTAKERP